MDANTYDLKTVLTLDRRFVIPTFQRDYEWTKDGQWQLLFDDLETVAERLEDARRSAALNGESVSKADKRVPPHFLGAIVLDQLPSPAGRLEVRSVIDGQQRLTTVQLLLRGLLDVLLELRSPRAAQVRRLIHNPPDVCLEAEERFKLWPRRGDRAVWASVISDEDAAASRDTATNGHLYEQGRRYFRERAKSAATTPDGADRSDLLVDAVLSLFKIVVIDLEDNDDAQVIFEVLNGRQTALSASDLVKNLLFLRAERAGEEDLERLYQDHWAKFDDPWWKEELGRGHATRGRRDVLLSVWLSANTAAEVNVGRLYAEVRGYLDGSERSVIEVLTDISRSAEAFRTIIAPGPRLSETLSVAYSRIDALGVLTALPALVWLRALSDAVLTNAAHELAVKAIESWVVRRILVGANTRGYGKKFIELIRAGKAAITAGYDPGVAVCEALSNSPQSMKWPTDEEVIHAALRRPMYNNLSQGRVRLVLAAIDRTMQEYAPKSERAMFTYDDLQIEHILPQSWREHWPIAVGDMRAEQRRSDSVDVLGNLTLVSKSLNPAMSNARWNVKRAALQEHSLLRLNREVLASDVWNEDRIDHRGRQLAKLICQIWPGPDVLLPTRQSQ